MQYSLVFIKGSASGTRLACFPIAKQGNGVDLAPPGEGVRLRISVALRMRCSSTAAGWFYGFLIRAPSRLCGLYIRAFR